MRARRFPLWVRVALPLAVLAVALIIGSGVLESAPETSTQRAAAIEADVRCPSCADLSVAQSNETTAIAARHQIESMVASGASTADIDRTLVAEYGQTVLLTPPNAGGIPVLWIVPVVVLVGALGGVAVLFWRRSRDFGELKQAERSEEDVSA
jgi:cytochrome c-type biogenesis protein CcmH